MARMPNEDIADVLINVLMAIDKPTSTIPVPYAVITSHIEAGLIVGEFVNGRSRAFQALFFKKLAEKYPRLA